MSKPKCRICRSTDLVEVLHYARAPRNIERLLETDELARDGAVELRAARCGNCGHVQLPVQLQVDYYEDYLMSHSHAKKMQEFQRTQAAGFLEHFALKGGRVFEAGCGDGQFSVTLREMGCEVLANEPSAKARGACEARGLETIAGYVTRGAFGELHGTFDAVVARQVLEHVPDPNDFLQELRSLLKPGGAGLIEVPSLEQALENERFFDFFPDHLSYFSATTLAHVCTRNMFEVVQVRRAMDGEYNEAWIRRTEAPDLEAIRLAAGAIAGAFGAFLSAEAARSRKVAVWGAGAKGVLTLAMVDAASVAYLIDSDPVKHGRYTPVSHLEVLPPQKLAESPVNTVIITALAYRDEISRDLRERYGFAGKIACLSGGAIIELEPDSPGLTRR